MSKKIMSANHLLCPAVLYMRLKIKEGGLNLQNLYMQP